MIRPAVLSRRVPIAIVIGLVLFSGVVHGVLDGRWKHVEDLNEVAAKLMDLPQQAGDWSLVDVKELEASAASMLRCYGSTHRVYEHSDSGAQIGVVLLFGPRGPIAVHTPEICYDSVGTKQVRDRRVESVATVNHKHELWSVEFENSGQKTDSFEVWYAWSDGDSWQAPKHPRFWLTDSLYKIQLSGPVSAGAQQACHDFLKEFLPQVEEVIQ